jgi:hypothetical protein
MNAPSRTDRTARRRTTALLVLACLAAFQAAGCCLFPPKPPPPPLPAADVVDAVRAQSENFHTVQDGNISLSITQVGADGKPDRLPTLGGALAFDAREPALWLYTEKLTQPIFALTAVGTRFWLVSYRTGKLGVGTEVAYQRIPALLRPEEVQSYFAGPASLGISWPTAEMTVEADDYRFDIRVLGVLRRQVYVDRRRLVLSGIRRYDALGRLETGLRLDRYKAAGGDEPFPQRLWLDRPLSGVTIELRLDNPEPNKPLKKALFTPPDPSQWTVIDLDTAAPSVINKLFVSD